MMKFIKLLLSKMDKHIAEERFWKDEISKYMAWYNGNFKEHYQTPSPTDDQKIRCYGKEHSAILTWFELHQKPKYAANLRLEKDIFRGMKVLDIGSGPIPSAEVFEDCQLYCLDPLLPNYIRAGYPIHCYLESTKFVYGYSETMPFEDNSFNAIVSVNAIDHVDDFSLTAKEIKRVLKPNGMLRMHVHYHKKTLKEPIEINDHLMMAAYSWCENWEKKYQSNSKLGAAASLGESYNLWSNF